MKDDQLLKVMQGVESTPEIDFANYWTELVVPGTTEHFSLRREARRTVLRARMGKKLSEKEDYFIEKIIKPQLDPNLNLDLKTFSFDWDIHPVEPCKIVRGVGEWFAAGGSIDPKSEAYEPTGFTKQEL
jgi:hypothetical protein